MTTKKQMLIDVREPDEFSKEHIHGAINIPMSTIEFGGREKFKAFEDHEIIIFCRSGERAVMVKKIIQHGCGCDVRVYEGGIIGWKGEGKEVLGNSNAPISVMRQVQISMGVVSIIFGLLAYFVSPLFIIGSIGIGAGMTFAGITSNCALATLIGKLPFNQIK